MEESTIRGLMGSERCSSCGEHYTAENVEVLGTYERLWFMSVFCSACQTRYLVTAEVSEGVGPAAVSGFSRDEARSFSEGRVPDENDVLDMHVFLEGFDGDFSGIFGEGDG